MSRLNIVATPIGNLKDLTLRSLEVLQSVDGIICEDTRRTSILLNHYQIKKPLFILNDFNEAKQVPFLLDKLIKGESLALVSDAGTPLIADPGFKLVRECIGEGILVDSLPGPSSIITALTLSNLPPHSFTFLNFLPDKSKARLELLYKIKNLSRIYPQTFIVFVSPYKLKTTLEEMGQTFGDIEVVLAKELTKIHQSVEKNKISEWTKKFERLQPKGEYILLFYLE